MRIAKLTRLAKGALAGAALVVLAAGGAQAAEIHHDRREVRRDHRELRLDRRDYRRDHRDLVHYRGYLRHDVELRRYAEARRARAIHRWKLHEGVR